MNSRIETQAATTASHSSVVLTPSTVVLIGYLLLGLLIVFAPGSLLQAALSAVLGLFGPGLSLVTALFPRQIELGVVERFALAMPLSIAVGGLLAFFLARAPWGLNAISFYLVILSFSLLCYLPVLFQSRGVQGSIDYRLRLSSMIASRWSPQAWLSNLVSIVLFLFLLSGVLYFCQTSLTVDTRPAMTEFFLLDENGSAQAYPENISPDGQINIRYGIINREKEVVTYTVRALVDGEVVATSPDQRVLNENQIRGALQLQLPETVSSQTQVQVALYHNGDAAPYRRLHLWLEVERDNRDNIRARMNGGASE